jgi:hypothetical protein
MHYAEFAEDEVRPFSIPHSLGLICELQSTDLVFFLVQSQALLNAIKEYENNKWKVIGQKVGKPAKVSFGLLTRVYTAACTDGFLNRHVNSTPKSTSQVRSFVSLRQVKTWPESILGPPTLVEFN